MNITQEEFNKLAKEVRASYESKLEYAEASYEEAERYIDRIRGKTLNEEEVYIVDEVAELNGYIYDLVLNKENFNKEFALYYQGALSLMNVNEDLLVDLNRILERITFNLDVLDLLR